MLTRGRDALERLGHDLGCVAGDRARRQGQPVGQDRRRERLDVVGQSVVAAVEGGERLRGAEEHEAGAGARAQLDAGVGAGRLADGDDVAAKGLRRVDLR